MGSPNYKETFDNMLQQNFKEFNLEDDAVKLKIKNFCQKFNFDEELVIYKLKTEDDNLFKAWFIKDPTKQNIYEMSFLLFLKELPNVKNPIKLPNAGPDAIYIVSQEVRKGKDLIDSIKKQAKSIDFKFNYKDLKTDFYVFHKYTRQGGGAQDNQKNDVINAMDKATNPYISQEFIILFICDGEYYKGKKWEELSNHANQSKNFVLLKSEDLEKFLETYYQEHKK